jgi:hypothetical protein
VYSARLDERLQTDEATDQDVRLFEAGGSVGDAAAAAG